MISVLYLIDRLSEGGSERYVSELALNGNKFGISPFVGCFSKGGSFYDDLLKNQIPLTCFPTKTLYHPTTIISIIEIIRFIRINDIKIIHSFQPNANILGTLIGTLIGIPVIVSRRSLGDYGSLGSKRLAWFQKNVSNSLSNRVLVNSMAVRDATIKNEGIPAKKITLIYNGLDTLKFSPIENYHSIRQFFGIPPQLFVFGVVSGLRPVKAVDVVIKGFSYVCKNFPNSFLCIVGDGEEKGNLESLVKSLGIESSVLFLGTQSFIENLLPAFNAFVLCSHSEGFSNALLEAMGVGLPVIATNVGGNVEMVHEGVNGYLVPPNNPELLSQKMASFLQNKELAKKMGRNGRLWVEQTNSLSIVHAQFSRFYEEIASE